MNQRGQSPQFIKITLVRNWMKTNLSFYGSTIIYRPLHIQSAWKFFKLIVLWNSMASHSYYCLYLQYVLCRSLHIVHSGKMLVKQSRNKNSSINFLQYKLFFMLLCKAGLHSAYNFKLTFSNIVIFTTSFQLSTSSSFFSNDSSEN